MRDLLRECSQSSLIFDESTNSGDAGTFQLVSFAVSKQQRIDLVLAQIRMIKTNPFYLLNDFIRPDPYSFGFGSSGSIVERFQFSS